LKYLGRIIKYNWGIQIQHRNLKFIAQKSKEIAVPRFHNLETLKSISICNRGQCAKPTDEQKFTNEQAGREKMSACHNEESTYAIFVSIEEIFIMFT